MSVFGQAVRTNNDVEGWDGMLNGHAKRGILSFYLLVRLLQKQAKLVQAKHASAFDQKLKIKEAAEAISTNTKAVVCSLFIVDCW